MIGQPPAVRLRAIAAWLGDELIGVGGFLYAADGRIWASMVVRPELRAYPAALWRGAVMTMRLAESCGIREVLAVADDEQPAAARFLARLGFELIGEYQAEPLYRWRHK